MNNQIQIRPVSTGAPAATGDYASWSMGDRVAYANTLAQATDLIPRGLFDPQTGRPSPAKIFLVLETGVMLDIHPMAALAGIDVIEGTATVTPRLFGALARRAGHDIEKIERGSIAGGDFAVTVNFTRGDTGKTYSETWDMRRTVQAGLVDSYAPEKTGPDKDVWKVVAVSARKGEPLPWQQYPEDMCYWRALGRIARKHGADVLMGIGYFPEELEAQVDRTGARVQIDVAAEDALLARIAEVDDKADMETIWWDHHYPMEQGGGARDTWTERVAAEFDAHLMVCTKDSRPPRPGAPGHTGDPAVDGKGESGSEPRETTPLAGADDENVSTGADGVEPVSGAPTAADDDFTLEVPEGDKGALDLYASDVDAYDDADTESWEAEAIRRHEAGLE